MLTGVVKLIPLISMMVLVTLMPISVRGDALSTLEASQHQLAHVDPGLTEEEPSTAALTLLTEAWPPMSYEEAGEPKGFAVELIQLLQKRLQLNSKIEFYPWARAVSMATATPNVLLFTTSMDDNRRSAFSFVGPIAVNRIHLYARSSDPVEVTSLAQAKTLGTTGVYRGSTGESLLLDAGFKNLLIASFPQQSAKQLIRSRVRFWCQADLAVESLLNDVGANIAEVKPVYVLSELDLYLAFSKGTSKAEIQRWHDNLKALYHTGEMAKLYRKWFGDLLPPPEPNDIYWVKD